MCNSIYFNECICLYIYICIYTKFSSSMYIYICVCMYSSLSVRDIALPDLNERYFQIVKRKTLHYQIVNYIINTNIQNNL